LDLQFVALRYEVRRRRVFMSIFNTQASFSDQGIYRKTILNFRNGLPFRNAAKFVPGAILAMGRPDGA